MSTFVCGCQIVKHGLLKHNDGHKVALSGRRRRQREVFSFSQCCCFLCKSFQLLMRQAMNFFQWDGFVERGRWYLARRLVFLWQHLVDLSLEGKEAERIGAFNGV